MDINIYDFFYLLIFQHQTHNIPKDIQNFCKILMLLFSILLLTKHQQHLHSLHILHTIHLINLIHLIIYRLFKLF
jgi:hypothetical protein